MDTVTIRQAFDPEFPPALLAEISASHFAERHGAPPVLYMGRRWTAESLQVEHPYGALAEFTATLREVRRPRAPRPPFVALLRRKMAAL